MLDNGFMFAQQTNNTKKVRSPPPSVPLVTTQSTKVCRHAVDVSAEGSILSRRDQRKLGSGGCREGLDSMRPRGGPSVVAGEGNELVEGCNRTPALHWWYCYLVILAFVHAPPVSGMGKNRGVPSTPMDMPLQA